MNFPATQKTGRRAEVAVEDHFLSWDWNVGHDHIDNGYDLCITPTHAVYQGIRFSVQVKGTSLPGKQTPSANVSKKRLRQYARDILPVFIVRVTPDGTLYWVHAQAWAKLNENALVGSGSSRVSFDPARTLADRTAFEAYLDRVVRPFLDSADLLSVVNEARVFDPNAGRLNASPKPKVGKAPRASANPPPPSTPPEAHLSFRPLRSEENIAKLREAWEYGLPRSFEVEDFNITPPIGFPALKEIGVAQGRVTMRQIEAKTGLVHLCPGTKYSILSQELALPVDLYAGTKGTGITNESHPSALDFSMRLTPENGLLRADINLGLRVSTLNQRAIRHFRDLGPLATWAEQVAAEDAMHLTLDFEVSQHTLSPGVQPVEGIHAVLQGIRALSRLHMIARTLDSDFVLPAGMVLSADEFQDINLAFELLKGERKAVNLGPIEVEPRDKAAMKMARLPGELLCTTTWLFALGGQAVGAIPIEINLPDYVVEKMPGTGKIRIAKGQNGKAWVTYAEHGDTSSRVVRITK